MHFCLYFIYFFVKHIFLLHLILFYFWFSSSLGVMIIYAFEIFFSFVYEFIYLNFCLSIAFNMFIRFNKFSFHFHLSQENFNFSIDPLVLEVEEILCYYIFPKVFHVTDSSFIALSYKLDNMICIF